MPKQVQQGYKQTPVGVIPEDWEVITVGEAFKFIKTYSNSREDLTNIDKISYIHYGEIHKYYKFYIDFNKCNLPKINENRLSNEISFVQNGDLVMADASEDYADIGKSVEIINLNTLAVSGLHTFLLRDTNNRFANGYKGYIFYNKEVSKNLKKIATGASVLGISKTNLLILNIPLPPHGDQEKIAEILSTWDNAIAKQEELIEQKQQFKKSIMQQIFSQKLCFKNDDGSDYQDWEEKKLGDVIICLDNKRIPINSEERTKIRGNIPYYGANGIVDYISKFIFDEQLVLLAEDGGNFDEYLTRPIAQLISGKSWVNNHAHVIKGSSENYTPFVFYSLVHKDIRQWINGTSRSKLNKSDMFLIKTLVPITLKEQQKVADFLMTIDNEITKQNQVLTQLKSQKKSLMQKLLTGQVRAWIPDSY